MAQVNEAARAERIARQQRETEAAEARAGQERGQLSVGLLGVGILLMAIGVWVLIFSPSLVTVDGVAVANLQRLTIGETASIAGAILFAAGARLRY